MTNVKNRSTKMPPQVDISAIYFFVAVVLKDLGHLRIHPKSNCTHAELEAIQSLEKDDEIILKSSE